MRHLLICMLALSCACQAPIESPTPPAPPRAQAAVEPSPAAQLDAIDTRRPLPLLPQMAVHQKQNMREHLENIQTVLDALARDDMASVEAAAKRLGTSPQMRQMCAHMGAGAPGFTEMALAFHEEADTIAAAAQANDHKAALRATARTLNHCTSCHATFKQQLVSELP